VAINLSGGKASMTARLTELMAPMERRNKPQTKKRGLMVW